jgi:hypothetical protein
VNESVALAGKDLARCFGRLPSFIHSLSVGVLC